MEITIWGVLVGAVLPLFGYLAFHYLAIHREREARFAESCGSYRSKIVQTTSRLPAADKHWDNEVLALIPGIVGEVGVAVEIFGYFLPRPKRNQLEAAYTELKSVAEKDVPSAMSSANVLYGGGQQTPQTARKSFWEKIEELKSFATKT